GGKGKTPGAAYQGPDLSRQARYTGGRLRNCGFPPEADVAQINHMKIVIVVTIGADGKPTAVSALNDPGYGFVARARRCALADKFEPALSKSGKPIASTVTMTVTFDGNCRLTIPARETMAESTPPPSSESPPSQVANSQRLHGEHVQWLQKADLFRDLKPAALSRIARVTQEETHASGSSIFKHGDPGDKLCVILEGKVRIARDLHGLGEETLAV